MHPTTPLSTYRRRPAGFARAGLGAAALARQHRSGVTRMGAGHLVALRFSGTGMGARSPKFVIGAVCASASAGGEFIALSGLVTRGVCVTSPTIACPPSLTDT